MKLTRSAIALAVLAVGLAACGRPAVPTGEPIPSLHPGPITVSRITGADQVTEYRDPRGLHAVRERAGRRLHTVHEYASGRTYHWVEGASRDGVQVTEGEPTKAAAHWRFQERGRRLGACHVAGEAGTIWQVTLPDNIKQPRRIEEACITPDGVVLSEQIVRAAASPASREAWRATRVVRGPLPGEAFAVLAWLRRPALQQ